MIHSVSSVLTTATGEASTTNLRDVVEDARAWLQLAHEFHLPLPATELDGLTVEAGSHEPLEFGDEIRPAYGAHPRGELIKREVLHVPGIGFAP
jgi:hypothetical protein